MKIFWAVLVFIVHCELCIVNHASAQNPGEWMWVHGSNTTNNMGIFGIQGVSAPANTPPSFYTSCGWTDLNGNFWLFGGWRNNGNWGDLWKFDQAINEWIWIKGSGIANDPGNYGVQGIPSPTNYPPARGNSVSWTDSQGDLWLFSGNGGGDYCDLWKYNIAANEWTWMKGPNIQSQPAVYGSPGISDPANHPGSRQETAATWTDAQDNLWLFGGYRQIGGAGHLNDLWKYSIQTNEWTWMKGSSSTNPAGNYGTIGIEDTSNTPGGRMPYAHWKDNAGNLWMWGGWENNSGNYNDMWRYSIASNNWTWIGGSQVLNSPIVMGTKCVADSANIPGTGWETRAVWTDVDGNFWFFGAGTYVTSFILYNQLWKYCVSSGMWIWISGDVGGDPPGSWGTIGVSSPLNKPSGRIGSTGWTNNNRNLYLFGGEHHGGATYNDLWVYEIDSTCAPCLAPLPTALIQLNPSAICPGTCADFINLSTNATSYQWFFPGGAPDSSTSFSPSGICYNTPGTYNVMLIASNTNGSDTLTLQNYITVFPPPAAQSIMQSGDTLFAIAGSSSYQWYFNGNIISGATNYFYIATASGDYNMVATDENGCEVEAVINNVIASSQLPVSSSQFVIFPNPVEDKFTIQNLALNLSKGPSGTVVEISIYNMIGEKVMTHSPLSFGEGPGGEAMWTVDCRPLSPGIYYIEINADNKIFRSKFLKQ